jgi:hypothetical protein
VLLDKSLRFILGALRQESGAERNDAREADAG